nr:hypothetical protein [Mesorhizobium sp.]
MGLELSNNATSVLAANINAATTSFAIQSGDEGTFPTLGVGDWHPITVVDAVGNREVMRCTARSGVTLTVVRAQEGTTALSFSARDRVDVRFTASAFLEALSDATRLTTGLIDRTLLGDGLQAIASEIASLDALEATGFYRNASDATGSPTPHAGFFSHIESDDGSAYQVWRRADTRERMRALDVWGAWTQLRTSASAQDALFYSKAGGALTGKATTVASTTDNGAGLNVAPGAVPDTPVNGDVWITTAGVFARVNGVTVQLSNVAPSLVVKDSIMVSIAKPENGDLRVFLDAGFAGTIKRAVSRSAVGTCTATVKINTTALGGTANSVSTTEQIRTHTTANNFAVGDDIVVTIPAAAAKKRFSTSSSSERCHDVCGLR